MTGKQKMRKRAGHKMKALTEKEFAASCSSNDSDTDVDVIFVFGENTSVEKRNCNKADLSLSRSQENLETYNPLMFSQRKFNKSLL